MQTRNLGNSDLQMTPIGFGTWAIGGGEGACLWGPQDDNDSVAAIHRALDAGINWIDTAAVYGFGRSERVVGRTIKDRSDKPYIFTKCTLVGKEGDASVPRTYKYIRQEVEESLRRLGVEAIDLYQCHWPIADEAEMKEGWGVMADLQREGKVRWLGASNYNVEQLKLALAVTPITSLQSPYSLINRSIEAELLPFCEANGIAVINYASMQSGLLTGAMSPERIADMAPQDWRRSNRNYREPLLSRNLRLVELLREIGRSHSRSPGEVAIAWTLRLKVIIGAIVGARSPGQVEGWLGAAEFRLSPDELERIQSFLDANPTPA
jgi:aryl-alcohol dehydrogenase-like predicted oxidoreductase